METLESSRVCRLCGKKSGISINIIDKNENHVKKINAILPIMVHEMDLLPKHMCHRCSYKLEEFHKFYVDCLKTDADLKSQLSWMRKEDSKEKIGVPMVYIENVKIKVEPPDYDVYELEPMVENVNYINSMSSVTFPVNDVQARGISEEITYAAYTRCRYCCDKKDQSKQTVSSSYETGVSRCNRPEKTDTQGDINKRVSERENPSGNKFPEIRIRSSDVRSLNDRRPSKYAANIKDIIAPFMENARGTENLSQDSKIGVKDTVIRNLRPRRRSVDYGGKKKTSKSQRKLKRIKLEQAPKCTTLKMLNMKVEKPHDFEGRILRPRKVIDYIGPKRKHTTNKKKRNSVQNNNRGRKQRTQGSKEFAKNPLKNNVKLEIKEEMLVGESVFASNGSKSATVQQPRGRKKSSTLFPQDGYTLPVDLQNAQNDLLNCTPVNRRVVDESKPPKDETTRIMLKRIANAFYSPKCLRSQSAYLRNGKVKKFNELGNSVKRQKKVIQNITERGQRLAKNLTQTTSTSVNVRQISGSNTKLVENIKHYCEKCNISFANLELYRLHACYD